MRTMLLMRGIPGSGKSTEIERYGLKPYAVCPDEVRLMFQSPVIDPRTGESSISQKNDRRVWKFVNERVEEKMTRGEFIVVDAMNIDVSQWKPLADRYRYNVFCRNLDAGLDECLSRNANREPYKRVPEEVVRSCHRRYEEAVVPRWCVPVDDMASFLDIRPYDADGYSRMVFFGDVHGCFQPLDDYFRSHPFDEGALYVFLGDYLDRGVQNRETLEFLMGLGSHRNVWFLEGNHWWERYWANGEEDHIKSGEFLEKTLPQIAGVDRKEVRKFCRRWRQMAYLEFRGRRYLATHAGMGTFPKSLLFTPAIDMIKGGRYEDDIDLWYEESGSDVIQIHGHRNTYEYNVLDFERTVNLNDDVEFGSPLRILEVDDGGMHEVLMENHVFTDQPNPWKSRHTPRFVNTPGGRFIHRLRNNAGIREKDLGNGVSSFNFTRDAFFSGKWDGMTDVARGLFLDTVTGDVVARSWRKFFNYCEGERNTDEFLSAHLRFPVTAYRKYNGFLGLVSVRGGELFFATKSTDGGDFARWFREIFHSTVGEESRDSLKSFLESSRLTLAFEVIDPVRDPHIIEYDRPSVVLLDAIRNDMEFEHLSYGELVGLAERHGLEVKRKERVFSDIGELLDFLHGADDMDDADHIEGYVMHDADDYMFKYKNRYYLTWKRCRGCKEAIDSGREVSADGLDGTVAAFVSWYAGKAGESPQERERMAGMSIIGARSEFMRSMKSH